MDWSFRYGVVSKDDWDLTRKELESQRLQLRIQLEVVDAGIAQLTRIIEGWDDD